MNELLDLYVYSLVLWDLILFELSFDPLDTVSENKGCTVFSQVRKIQNNFCGLF
jgi:hypothetical protein